MTNCNCGNKRWEPTFDESCDDGNWQSGDGCSWNCKLESTFFCLLNPIGGRTQFCTPICGDAIVVKGELCDDEYCKNCLSPKYGDYFIYSSLGEECDDGNWQSGDGCSPLGTIEEGWNCLINSQLYSVCLPKCGDGIWILGFE